MDSRKPKNGDISEKSPRKKVRKEFQQIALSFLVSANIFKNYLTLVSPFPPATLFCHCPEIEAKNFSTAKN